MSQISPPKPPNSPQDASKQNIVQRYAPWLYAFWKFSRPHTIIGTSLSVLGIWAIALATSPVSIVEGGNAVAPQPIYSLLFAWFTCLCGNIYIVGLNQMQDVAIDRINKPHLPIASGEFSRKTGWGIVITTGLIALLSSPLQGLFLTITVWSSVLIGTAYSLPPIRLKRFPFWASVCIFTVRGVIVNLGLFLHFSQQFGSRTTIPAPVWGLTLFILGFTFAIAIFKDIPDLEGDRRYNITTFTIRLGQTAVFNLARWVITACYVGMLIAGLILPSIHALFLVLSHGLALAAFWFYSTQVDLQQKQEITNFYQLIWKLFFLEYLIFPIACLLA